MNRKTSFLLAGALSLSFLLAACGDGEASSPSPAGSSSPAVSAPAEPSPSALGPSDVEEPSSRAPESTDPAEPSAPAITESAAVPSTSEPTDSEALKELAMTFIDKDVEELIAAIGEPTGSDYAPSCLGSGEDGELFYDGFSVYTYREGDTETVQDVL